MKIKIPITVYTDYEETGTINDTRLRLEESAYMTASLFSLIHRSTLVYDGIAINDAKPEFMFRHIEDIRLLSQLGEALALSVNDFAAHIKEAKIKSAEVLINEEGKLALALSEILNNPNAPEELSDAIQTKLNDIYNAGDGTVKSEFESSPEFLEVVLRAFDKRRTNEK